MSMLTGKQTLTMPVFPHDSHRITQRNGYHFSVSPGICCSCTLKQTIFALTVDTELSCKCHFMTAGKIKVDHRTAWINHK
jgi:hypothetical protein